MPKNRRKLQQQRFGPFVVLDGSHTEIDPLLTDEINKLAKDVPSNQLREAFLVKHQGNLRLHGEPRSINCIIRPDEQHLVGPDEMQEMVVERIYHRGDPPFMSVNDLDAKFNIRQDDGKGYKYPPKFQRSADAAAGIGINPEEMRRPGESLRDYADRMAKLAEAEAAQQPAKPQQAKR